MGCFSLTCVFLKITLPLGGLVSHEGVGRWCDLSKCAIQASAFLRNFCRFVCGVLLVYKFSLVMETVRGWRTTSPDDE